MPRFGAHMMTSGGLDRAFEAGRRVGCSVIQIFTKSPRQWKARPLSDADADAFRRAQEETGIDCVAAHDSYLINPAAADPAVLERSREALGEELARAARLGIPAVVMHPGATGEAPEEEALERLIGSVQEAFLRAERVLAGNGGKAISQPRLLLETTAGQGTCLGDRFEHLAAVLAATKRIGRVGACLDTCHVFAAGYELRDDRGYEETIAQFDRLVGLKNLVLIHANDSGRELGSRVDRHAHIGQGKIGLDGFRRLVNDPRLAAIPVVLETPKEGDMDPVNLAALRGLVAAGG
jgi:deoxyribonuclease-4